MKKTGSDRNHSDLRTEAYHGQVRVFVLCLLVLLTVARSDGSLLLMDRDLLVLFDAPGHTLQQIHDQGSRKVRSVVERSLLPVLQEVDQTGLLPVPEATAREPSFLGPEKSTTILTEELPKLGELNAAFGASQPTHAVARWGLENPSHLPHALERLEELQALPGWARKTMSKISQMRCGEQRQLARASLAAVLAETGAAAPNRETVASASSRLLDMALSLKKHSSSKALAFLTTGYQALDSLVYAPGVSHSTRDLLLTTARHTGYQEGGDPTTALLGLASLKSEGSLTYTP